MKILVVEQWSEAANSLIQELHAGTGSSIEHAGTLDEGLLKIERGHGSIDIVLYTFPPASSEPLGFPEQVRARAHDALFRCPHLVLLASAPLALPCAVKCMDRQVVYLLRDYPKQIVETVRVQLWKIRTPKPGPTIRVEFRGGHYRFFIVGLTASEEIVVSGQICRLLLLLLGSNRTVEMIADTLGVSRNTVKKYMRELRLIVCSMLERMCMTTHTFEVVWMVRQVGGTVCGLHANPMWE